MEDSKIELVVGNRHTLTYIDESKTIWVFVKLDNQVFLITSITGDVIETKKYNKYGVSLVADTLFKGDTELFNYYMI